MKKPTALLMMHALQGDSTRRGPCGERRENLMDIRNIVTRRAPQIAISAAFALNLVACDQRPSAEMFGRDIDLAVDKAGKQLEQAVRLADRKIELAADTAGRTITEAGKALEDATLTAKVKAALVAEPGLQALAIEVETSGGVVTLQGATTTLEYRDRAAQITLNVPGVKSVKNNLNVGRGT